ncbi:MAG: hypothetical protein WCU88_08390 [Elusimicrobiota bacterium]|jgi:hypothetical protein
MNIRRWTLPALAIILTGPSMTAWGKTDADKVKEISTWHAKAVEAVRLDCADLKQMRDVLCGVNDAEPYETEGKTAIENESARLVSQMKGKMGPVVSQYPSLQGYCTGSPSGELKKQCDALSKMWKKIQALMSYQIVKGAWNPKIQEAIEYGKAKHTELTGRYACDVHDIPLGGPTRPDCINILNSGCAIYEFKPDNDKAKAKGMRQIQGYIKQAGDYYTKCLGGSCGSSILGGTAAFDAMKKTCNKGNRIVFLGDLKTYPKCAHLNVYSCDD